MNKSRLCLSAFEAYNIKQEHVGVNVLVNWISEAELRQETTNCSKAVLFNYLNWFGELGHGRRQKGAGREPEY